MNVAATIPRPSVRRARRSRGRTLAEMMIALTVFATATLGIWECIRTVFFLSAKNTGLNLSHSALQLGVDRLTEQLRGSLQIVDVATFDGSTFQHLKEADPSAGPSTPGNAVRFVRLLPITLYLLPDDGKTYTMTSPLSTTDLNYPHYLTAGNKTVKATYTTSTSLTDPTLLADLTNARLFPRFPYQQEQVGTGTNVVNLPGLGLAGTPTFTSTTVNASNSPTTTGNVTISLTYGLPTTASTVPPSNIQAYLIVISAAAVLNRGTDYSELIYYPDASNLARSTSLTTALAPSTTGSGPNVFALPKTAGAQFDPAARASLQVSLPVYAPSLGNTVIRRGGTAALVNIELNLPVETRRRAFF